MKIYVIEKGQYSDRRVVGVTDNKQMAIKICKMGSNHKYMADDITYSEWDTEQFSNGLIRYRVEYFLGDWNYEFDDFWGEYDSNIEVYEDTFIIFADSPEQAIKIAQDMRAERIAKQKGLVE